MDASYDGAAGHDPRVTDKNRQENWLPVRKLATTAAAVAQDTVRTLKANQPSKEWAAEAGRILLRKLEEADPTGELLPWPSDAAKFCVKWGAGLLERGSVADAPRSGRRRKIPEDVVAAAAKLVETVKPRTQIEMEDHFAGYKSDHNVSSRTVWRRVKECDPKLGKHVLVEYKLPLTAAVKADRCQQCERWLLQYAKQPQVEIPRPLPPIAIPQKPEDLDTGKLDRIIWVDAKKFYVKPQGHKRWGRRGEPSIVVQDKRAKGAWAIHFYSAVNYKHGGLLIQLVSGTKGKGYKATKTYTKKVSGYDGVKHTVGGAPAMARNRTSNSFAWNTCTSR